MIIGGIKKKSKRKSVRRRVKGFAYLSIFLILIISIWFLTPIAKISSIRIVKDVQGVIEKSEVAEFISDKRKNSRGIISKDAKYLFIRQTIHSDLINEYARIESIKTDWEWWNKITIFIKERYPYINFCNELECGIADNNMYILDIGKDENLPEVFLHNPIQKGKNILNLKDATYLSTVIDYLNTLGISTQHVNIINDPGYKGQMELLTEQGTLIKLNPTDDIYSTTRLLYIAFKEKFKFIDNVDIGELGDIEYIDIRFGDYIIFKNKDE